jgi:hypothetical protein
MKEMSSEATSTDPVYQVAVGQGGLFGSCFSCWLGDVHCIFSRMTAQLPITDGSNIQIPRFFVLMATIPFPLLTNITSPTVYSLSSLGPTSSF